MNHPPDQTIAQPTNRTTHPPTHRPTAEHLPPSLSTSPPGRQPAAGAEILVGGPVHVQKCTQTTKSEGPSGKRMNHATKPSLNQPNRTTDPPTTHPPTNTYLPPYQPLLLVAARRRRRKFGGWTCACAKMHANHSRSLPDPLPGPGCLVGSRRTCASRRRRSGGTDRAVTAASARPPR
jgi:hypothetical protein